jgi:prefoldin subunit 5
MLDQPDNKVILLSDLIENRHRKEQELEYYQSELRKLLFRMTVIRQEINTTETIIDLIEHEKIVDLAKYIKRD